MKNFGEKTSLIRDVGGVSGHSEEKKIPCVVILASGVGKRISEGRKNSLPKPLVRFYGVPLIEHAILRFADKTKKIVVVYHDERVADFIKNGKERGKRGFEKVVLVKNNSPERENGFSFLLAKDEVKECDFFLLTMVDHFYNDIFLSDVMKSLDDEVKVPTAFVSRFSTDSDEATKIKVLDGRIKDIGKHVKDFDFYDTGLFLCTRDVIAVGEKLKDERESITLSDIVRFFSAERPFFIREVRGFWTDIDTVDDLKYAEKKLRSMLFKREDGPVSRYINRPVSTFLTKYLLRFDFITPNFISVVAGLLGLISAFLFASSYFGLGGVFAQLSSVIDGCDGEIARVKKLATKFGGVFDSVLDRYIDISIFTGAFLGISRIEGALHGIGISHISGGLFPYFFFFGFVAALSGVILVSYAYHLTGLRPKFITRDVRMFAVLLFGIFAEFLPLWSILLLFLSVGIVSHVGVLYCLVKFKGRA